MLPEGLNSFPTIRWSSSLFRMGLVYRDANRKSQKLFPFVNMVPKPPDVSNHLKSTGFHCMPVCFYTPLRRESQNDFHDNAISLRDIQLFLFCFFVVFFSCFFFFFFFFFFVGFVIVVVLKLSFKNKYISAVFLR